MGWTMSVAEHEEEPIDEWENFCSIHSQYYRVGLACGGCLDDSADQQFEMQRERTLEVRAQRREKRQAQQP